MQTPTYRLGGLRILSDFPLFGLSVCRDEAEVHSDVVIRLASIPAGIASFPPRFRSADYSERHNGEEVLLDFPAVGRFLLRAGKEILMDLAPSSDDNEVRTYLLGTVFGALCHQRG